MYALRDEQQKIVGHTIWPNYQTDQKVDQNSQEWIDYIAVEI